MKKLQNFAILLAVIIGLIAAGASKIFETFGYIIPVAVFLLVMILGALFQEMKKKKRLEYLRGKYGDEKIVQLIFKGNFWVGQDSQQLVDSIGRPVDIDYKVLKTKKKEIWKYQPNGTNRYRLRITLDNDVVVGWEKK